MRGRNPDGSFKWWVWPLTIAFIMLVGVGLLAALLAGAFVLAIVQTLLVRFWWIFVFGLGFYWCYRKLHEKQP